MREKILKLVDEYSRKESDQNKNCWFEMIFHELGARDKETALKYLSDLCLDKSIHEELKRRINEKLSLSDKSYMHKWSRDIIDRISNAKTDYFMSRAIQKSNNVIRSASKPAIVNRIYSEVAEGLNMSVYDLKKFLSSNPSDPVERATRVVSREKKELNQNVYDCLDYLGIEYEMLKKVQIGKYNLIVGAYLPEYDTIIETIKDEFLLSGKPSTTEWRKRELSKLFRKCIFLYQDESEDRMSVIEIVNERLNLGYRAMDLVDFI